MRLERFGWALLLMLCAPWVLVGCASGAGSPSPDEPMDEEMVTKRLQSDRAGLIFAQQEVALAQAQAASARSLGEPVSPRASEAAQLHQRAARFMLKLDEEHAQVVRDMGLWKSYVESTSKNGAK